MSTRSQFGTVASYVHPDGQLAALIELHCETAVTARLREFRDLAHDLAMQAAATRPVFNHKEQITEHDVEREREALRLQLAREGRVPDGAARFIDARLDKWRTESCLAEQPFIKDSTSTVAEVLIAKGKEWRERIVLVRFARFRLGCEESG